MKAFVGAPKRVYLAQAQSGLDTFFFPHILNVGFLFLAVTSVPERRAPLTFYLLRISRTSHLSPRSHLGCPDACINTMSLQLSGPMACPDAASYLHHPYHVLATLWADGLS